jgi:F0F1-type ATP synthase assembly protein I
VKDLLRAGPLLQMSWVVAFSVLIPLGVGILADRRFGTAPLFIIIGALIGIIGSTVAAVRIASRAIDDLGRPPTREAASDEPVDGKEDQA